MFILFSFICQWPTCLWPRMAGRMRVWEGPSLAFAFFWGGERVGGAQINERTRRKYNAAGEGGGGENNTWSKRRRQEERGHRWTPSRETVGGSIQQSQHELLCLVCIHLHGTWGSVAEHGRSGTASQPSSHSRDWMPNVTHIRTPRGKEEPVAQDCVWNWGCEPVGKKTPLKSRNQLTGQNFKDGIKSLSSQWVLTTHPQPLGNAALVQRENNRVIMGTKWAPFLLAKCAL